MILVDSEVLVALVNRTDRRHLACVEALQALRQPLATAWPVLTAALTSTDGLPAAQGAILEMVARGAVRLAPLDQQDAPRLRQLMAKPRRNPMSLAHAALVRIAERDGFDTAFTLVPAQFAAYRIGGRRHFGCCRKSRPRHVGRHVRPVAAGDRDERPGLRSVFGLGWVARFERYLT